MIEEREKRHPRRGGGRAAGPTTEAQALLAQHQELLREAGRQREEIMKRALADAEQAAGRPAGPGPGRGRAACSSKAREQIEREKQLAIQELRGQVADLAVEAASRIVESSLTPEAQRKLVDEFIEGLPKN